MIYLFIKKEFPNIKIKMDYDSVGSGANAAIAVTCLVTSGYLLGYIHGSLSTLKKTGNLGRFKDGLAKYVSQKPILRKIATGIFSEREKPSDLEK